MEINRNAPALMNETPQSDRATNERSATALFQARYGEKPKEARPVKKTLDKDDFMRIMITEMKHQDPTKPMDSDRMATQMAQITSVEQMKNVSNSIEKLSEKSNASDRLAMSMMIGKSVTVDKSRFAHQKATVAPISFDLPEAASKIKLVVLDDRGEEVATRELDPMEAGPNTYSWDGVNSSNLQAPSGNYSIRIDAENKNGSKLKVNSITRENVVGVTFEGGEANFLIGNPKSPQKVGMKNIIRLEGDVPPAGYSAKKEVSAEPQNGEFPLPENLKAKLGLNDAKEESNPEPVADVADASTGVDNAEGFPNGLND
jgi:flagellar basal-body rod modification protein FlgD